MNAKLTELPAVIRDLVKASGLNKRKILVLCVERVGHAVTDGQIVAALGNKAPWRIPYDHGGGERSMSPVVVVKGWSCDYVAISRPNVQGFPYTFKDAATIGVAVDFWLERGAGDPTFEVVAA